MRIREMWRGNQKLLGEWEICEWKKKGEQETNRYKKNEGQSVWEIEREREELLGTETNNRNNEIEVIENDK